MDLNITYTIYHITSGGISQRVYKKLQLYYSLIRRLNIQFSLNLNLIRSKLSVVFV